MAENRGVSQLIQGTRTVLMPKDNERMNRRRLRLRTIAREEQEAAAKCAEAAAAEAKFMSLPVVAE